MIESPYQPPSESVELPPTLESQREQSSTHLFKASQLVCYGWLLILVWMVQQDGVNFLIQQDIGRLISIVTGCMTLAVTTIYIRQRHHKRKRHCVVYCAAAGFLQLGVVNMIANHSVERFPL